MKAAIRAFSCVFFALCASVSAQTTGRLTGSVVDPAGEVWGGVPAKPLRAGSRTAPNP